MKKPAYFYTATMFAVALFTVCVLIWGNNMITVIGWETTQEAIDQNVADSRRKEARQKKSPLVKKFESEHTAMRADLNREIERKIERAWLNQVCRPII